MSRIYMVKTLAIIVRDDEDIEWRFYRKSFKKARWRKAGQRLLNDYLKIPAPKGVIWVK